MRYEQPSFSKNSVSDPPVKLFQIKVRDQSDLDGVQGGLGVVVVSTSQGLLYATRDTAVCALSDYSALAEERGWVDVEAMHDEYVDRVESGENLSTSRGVEIGCILPPSCTARVILLHTSWSSMFSRDAKSRNWRSDMQKK